MLRPHVVASATADVVTGGTALFLEVLRDGPRTLRSAIATRASGDDPDPHPQRDGLGDSGRRVAGADLPEVQAPRRV